jgi:hypothetical protein
MAKESIEPPEKWAQEEDGILSGVVPLGHRLE